MSLEYKTQTYLRKAIRTAEFTREADAWRASLPAFGLSAIGYDRDAAEALLMDRLNAYVFGAHHAGLSLPIIDGVDLNLPSAEPTESQLQALDGLADYAIRESQAGRTINLLDFAADKNIALDVS